ncbi:PTS transporter subunit EIIC [Mammaliicoccus sciuri]|uniref:PTS transporter subunit EIIC n=1 Tax=Mammaliicoccus sciuri TaxID=1296 RepID=UPI0031FF0C8D
MGLILGIGSSFTSESMIDVFPFLENNMIQLVLKFLATVGGFAFTYLPVLFAIAIPIGLVKHEKRCSCILRVCRLYSYEFNY